MCITSGASAKSANRSTTARQQLSQSVGASLQHTVDSVGHEVGGHGGRDAARHLAGAAAEAPTRLLQRGGDGGGC